MSHTIAAIEFKEAIHALYKNDRYFKFLDLEFRDLDDTDFRLGGLYRCIQDFCANDTGPHDMQFGCANAGETMWFIGVDYFAYDGLQALFFHTTVKDCENSSLRMSDRKRKVVSTRLSRLRLKPIFKR